MNTSRCLHALGVLAAYGLASPVARADVPADLSKALCTTCHTTGKTSAHHTSVTGYTCKSCHNIHRPFSSECNTCHTDPYDIHYYSEWEGSGHADLTATAWNYSSTTSTTCARCHSNTGFRDWLGADGTAQWVVNNAGVVGDQLECKGCHNSVTLTLSQVTFPSTITITGLGPEAICMQCHQGRSSKRTVDIAICKAVAGATGGTSTNCDTDPYYYLPATDDTAYTSLSFSNIHYFPAGATLAGTEAQGGYEYSGNTYEGWREHTEGYEVCQGCHDQHSLELRLAECADCHTSVVLPEDTYNIREGGSVGIDYDGDGDATEGIYYEIDTLVGYLYADIQAYTTAFGMTAICYEEHTNPYWFKDNGYGGGTAGNGVCDTGEYVSANRYSGFSPSLEKACYNYQMAMKDPGRHGHNPTYMLQLLYDSISDVNGDTTGLTRP